MGRLRYQSGTDTEDEAMGQAPDDRQRGASTLARSAEQKEREEAALGQALRVLAQEGRDERMNQAEKKAAALPPKLTVPMILFFLPVLLIVILIPAVVQVFGWN